MLVALVCFNVIHPGKIITGKESDFPSRKERKNMALAYNYGIPDSAGTPLQTVEPNDRANKSFQR